MIIRIKDLLGFVLSAVLLLADAGVRAQEFAGAFLRFSGGTAMVGDSTDPQFPGVEGWVVVNSMGGGITKAVNLVGTGTTSGSAQLETVVFTKAIDAASPVLFKTLASGTAFASAQFAMRRAGVSATHSSPFYTATLKPAFVTSVKWTSGGDALSESVSLQYVQMSWAYIEFDAEGNPTTRLSVNWDQILQTGGGVVQSAVVSPVLGYPSAQSVAAGSSIAVIPTAGPSDPSGLDHITVKSVGGYTGGISVAPGTGIVTLMGAAPVGGPYAIVIEAVDNNLVTTDASFNLTVNAAKPLVSLSGGGPAGNLTIRCSSQATNLRLEGIPGSSYQLQTATSALGPWTNAGNPILADANGYAEWVEPSPPAQAFYRAFNTPR
jgi:type VI secretion system Hcp family effector